MLSKFESINSIVDYLREPLSTSAAATKSSHHTNHGLKATKKQRKGKGLANGMCTTPSPPQLSPQSQSVANIEALPKGRVRYGPITVNPRKLPSKTLFTGRRSKYEVLSNDEEERRRDRRERNRVAATKCREKRETVLARLEDQYDQELQHHQTLLKHIKDLQQRKQYLQSVLTNRPNDCPLLNPTPPPMVFGNAGFLSTIVDTPPPLLPLPQQPNLYQEDDELSHFLDPTLLLTNSAYESDSSNGFFLPPQEQQAQPINMTTSSIERLINSLQSPTVSMENAGNHSMLFNSAVGASCAQQHSHSSDDDSLPPARSHPYVY